MFEVAIPMSIRMTVLSLMLVALSPIGFGTGSPDALMTSTTDCELPNVPSPDASGQDRAKVGAYYFDGWSGSLDDFHFDGLLDGPFQDRKPLSGWRTTPCSLEKQLVWARGYGTDFFVFLHYPGAEQIHPHLNRALQYYRNLEDRRGINFALMYVNGGDFRVSKTSWDEQVETWSEMFGDQTYVMVNGKPLFMILDVFAMRKDFGEQGVENALHAIRTAAKEEGFPGAYIVGGFHLVSEAMPKNWTPYFADLATDGYDALSLYNYPFVPPAVDGGRPYSDLVEGGEWLWRQMSTKSPIPQIPVVMNGWDPRPWADSVHRYPAGELSWYRRDPATFGNFVDSAVQWANAHPRSRVRSSHRSPMIIVSAWNELAEGNYMIPTIGDRHEYGQAMANTLVRDPVRQRSKITLQTNDAGENPMVRGTLTDQEGNPIEGGRVSLSFQPLEGPGVMAKYTLSGTVPPWAEQALVGFRVNTEEAGPGPADLSLTEIRFVEADNPDNRVPNGDFSHGRDDWHIGGTAQIQREPNGDRVVQVTADTIDEARLDSPSFSVTSGAGYEVTFQAKIAPSTDNSHYFMLIFNDRSGKGVRMRLPTEAGSKPIQSITTSSDGEFAFPLPTRYRSIVEARYAGDADHWPAFRGLEVERQVKDSDGDGVPDDEDLCPDYPGRPEADGC